MDKANQTENIFLKRLEKYIVESGYYVDEREYHNFSLHLYSTDTRYYEFYYLEGTLIDICELELEEIAQNYSHPVYSALALFHRKEFEEMILNEF